MPRDMFGDIVEPSIKVGSKKWYTVPLSIIVHTVIIGALIIIPLMAFDALPTPPTMMAFMARRRRRRRHHRRRRRHRPRPPRPSRLKRSTRRRRRSKRRGRSSLKPASSRS